MIVYKARNKMNGKIYVGLTRFTIERRLVGHLCCNNTPFQKALRKYGKESFEFSILDNALNYNALCKLEMKWIKKLDCIAPNGYNLTAGGEGLFEPTEETRRKIGESAKGRFWSAEQREQVSRRFLGVKRSKEHCRIISRTHKGKVYSEETRRKIGIASARKKMSSISRLMIWMWLVRERRPDQVRGPVLASQRGKDGRFLKGDKP